MRNDGGLRQEFRKHLKKVHWVTIESRFTESGIPDLNGVYGCKEFWLELKQAKHWTVKIRPMQASWILTRCRHGGKVFIAVRRKNKHDDELWLINGESVIILREFGLQHLTPEALAGHWTGGPMQWDWDQVLTSLVSE
jgi:hypothetical protein